MLFLVLFIVLANKGKRVNVKNLILKIFFSITTLIFWRLTLLFLSQSDLTIYCKFYLFLKSIWRWLDLSEKKVGKRKCMSESVCPKEKFLVKIFCKCSMLSWLVLLHCLQIQWIYSSQCYLISERRTSYFLGGNSQVWAPSVWTCRG